MASISVKGGSVVSLADARYFSSKMARMVGFCFDSGSESFISPREAQQIIGWLEGPQIVGEFNGSNLSEIRETAMILGLHLVQFPVQDNTEGFDKIEQPIILEVAISATDTLADLQQRLAPWADIATYYQFNLRKHFTDLSALEGSALGTDGLQQLLQAKPSIVDLNITADQLATIEDLGAEMVNLTIPADNDAAFDNAEAILVELNGF